MNLLVMLITTLQPLSPSSPVDWVAIAGIAGTLIGTALGSFVTWKIQLRQLKHENKTLFHEKRLALYTDFLYAVIFIKASKDTNRIITGENLKNENSSLISLGFVATDAVKIAAEAIHDVLIRIEQADFPTPEPLNVEFQKLVNNFITSARDEMEIDKYK